MVVAHVAGFVASVGVAEVVAAAVVVVVVAAVAVGEFEPKMMFGNDH